MQIPIDIDVLKSVLSIKDDKAAGKIIDETKRVRINENTLIVVEPKNQKMTVPTDLSDGLLVIDLINEHGGTTTTLAYDLKAGKFLKQEDEDEDEDEKKKNERK
jgi:hypothetical protein